MRSSVSDGHVVHLGTLVPPNTPPVTLIWSHAYMMLPGGDGSQLNVLRSSPTYPTAHDQLCLRCSGMIYRIRAIEFRHQRLRRYSPPPACC
jgi:hypothetical protein